MQQDNLNNMNNVTVKDHLAHQAQLQTFNSLNKVWNPAVYFSFFYLKIIFKTIKVELLQTHGIRSAGKIYFLFLSLLYPTYAAIQARDKHSDITFFYKKSSQVFCKKLLCLAGMCGVAFQRGDKRVKYFIIHFNLMA